MSGCREQARNKGRRPGTRKTRKLGSSKEEDGSKENLGTRKWDKKSTWVAEKTYLENTHLTFASCFIFSYSLLSGETLPEIYQIASCDVNYPHQPSGSRQ